MLALIELITRVIAVIVQRNLHSCLGSFALILAKALVPRRAKREGERGEKLRANRRTGHSYFIPKVRAIENFPLNVFFKTCKEMEVYVVRKEVN